VTLMSDVRRRLEPSRVHGQVKKKRDLRTSDWGGKWGVCFFGGGGVGGGGGGWWRGGVNPCPFTGSTYSTTIDEKKKKENKIDVEQKNDRDSGTPGCRSVGPWSFCRGKTLTLLLSGDSWGHSPAPDCSSEAFDHSGQRRRGLPIPSRGAQSIG